MQRRKVDFPDPDGPIMHSTSPVRTSRSMPRSTSSRPKCLRTPSAHTMSSLMGVTARRYGLWADQPGQPMLVRADEQPSAQPL